MKGLIRLIRDGDRKGEQFFFSIIRDFLLAPLYHGTTWTQSGVVDNDGQGLTPGGVQLSGRKEERYNGWRVGEPTAETERGGAYLARQSVACYVE